MTEPHPDGYRRHDREPIGKRDPDERVADFEPIWREEWDADRLRDQGERCMDCAVPTCTSGCPIGNHIPDWNDLVYRDDWRAALDRLHATNNFPEFTGYTCPAPCEPACVLAYNDDPVTIKSIERAIVDRGWEEGWIEPRPPTDRTGHEVAIVGSGPTGLAAAQQLNRVGHRVTVYERDDAIGGLMRYGIPDFKFDKQQVVRRVDQLRQEGIAFRTGVEVGGDGADDVPLARLTEAYDAACLAVGAQQHRDLDLPGRDLDGIRFAMDYLRAANRLRAGKPLAEGERGDEAAEWDGEKDANAETGSDADGNEDSDLHAAGKHIVVLGGGDTGADCVATVHRQGAAQVVQIDTNREPPATRPPDNPWPEQPQTYETTYAQAEGGVERFGVDTRAFVDRDGDGRVDYLRADRVDWSYDDDENRVEKTVREAGLEIPADLVLVAIGFTGPDATPFADLGVRTAADGTIRTDDRKMTDVEGVFAAGDAIRGQSLVVWAIGEGRDVARHIDRYLTGDSNLPSSLETANPPLESQ